MTEKGTIINLGNYRLRKRDRLNWQIEELRRPDATSARAHTEIKDDSPRWYPLEHYFQSPGAGVSWLLDHEMLVDGGEYDLDGAVYRFGRIAADLRAHVDEAAKQAGWR